MTPLTLRTTFYSLALVFAFGQMILCSVFADWYKGFAPYMYIFQATAIGWAVITWIWASVLLAFNNRPLSKHGLTRSLVHFTSFTIIAVGWLALAIGMATQFPLQCDFVTYSDGEAYVWCGSGATEFTVSVLLWLFCSASAIVIYRAARKFGGLSANVNVAESGNVISDETAPA